MYMRSASLRGAFSDGVAAGRHYAGRRGYPQCRRSPSRTGVAECLRLSLETVLTDLMMVLSFG
jgi:hypothetical protein